RGGAQSGGRGRRPPLGHGDVQARQDHGQHRQREQRRETERPGGVARGGGCLAQQPRRQQRQREERARFEEEEQDENSGHLPAFAALSIRRFKRRLVSSLIKVS